MRESISYTATINLIIVFIIIVFTFLSATLIYYKSNKVGKIITNSIEKYEGYNKLAENEVLLNLTSIGYNKKNISCGNISSCTLIADDGNVEFGNGDDGYCVYLCEEDNYYYYRIKTNMMINIPIINDLLNIPVFSNTNRLYDFEENLSK